MNHPIRDCSALAFASFFPGVMALIYFVVLHNPEGGTNHALIAAFGAGKIIQFLFPAAYVRWFEREKLGFAWPTRNGLLLGGLFGLVVGAAIFGLYFGVVRDLPAVERTPAMVYARLKQFGRDTPIGFLQMSIYICVIHSLAEEYYWRWFVFGWMRRHVPTYAAIALSSIGFMLHHIVIVGAYFPGHFWTLAMPFSSCVAVGGAVWAWLYQRTESLYAPWLSHALIDAAIMGVGYVMLRPLFV